MEDRRDPVNLEEEPFRMLLRPLAEAYLSFIRESDRHAEKMGLTGGQFDVIATLGDTDGMCCRELSEKTLVTKGTLTGVLDRLERKGLIYGTTSPSDRRIRIIRLTNKGEALFRKVFPEHMDYLKPFFQRALTGAEMKTLKELLLKVRDSFQEEPGSPVA
ncbi:MarR family winged helix-turn-helix transcriptional regulator [Leptospirillum ferriphilum]|jgi:DNA-binding MarR family transcriptional regulator|uniref:Transcriptional regulator, MarR family n=2 Tax=Leptospirillum TaxID=179 RepID=J9ZF97_LEPFM|nr:MarR family transcriptional regulator [Leptospirillum ferriphilum]AFS54277.1 transcriptional regulator, MarR family [Leptospirillum ferriphilum ML-04]EDZ40335.1 MAG: Transcriptional regulator, MarR family [Leptospirillum sp. Group II '5-way CG']